MPTNKLTSEIITAAIEGFESQKRRIDNQIGALRALLPGGPTETAATPEAAPTKRKVSAAARRRMALGQKARWAKLKGTSEPPTPATPEPVKAKRTLSAAGRANIVAALRKRLAAKKAAAPVAANRSAAKNAPVKKTAKKTAKKKTANASAKAVTKPTA